jgi:hypothetical protein
VEDVAELWHRVGALGGAKSPSKCLRNRDTFAETESRRGSALPRTSSKNNRQKPLHEASPEELRAIAEERFKKRELQKADAPVAMREYRDAEQALRDRTAKLRAERRAREAAKKV